MVTPQVGARHALDDDGGEVAARIAVDTISAASVDVISHATMRFTEIREEAELSAAKRVAGWLPGASYRFSNEPDYRSHTGTLSFERRLGGPDTTLAGTVSRGFDTVGRSGTPFSIWSRELTTGAATLSLSQVLNPRTVVRVAYSLTVQNGYLEKPYRFVPLFDAAGLAAAESDGVELDLDSFDRYRLSERPPEEVPDERVRHAVALRALRYLTSWKGSLRGDYRFYDDSWGLIAHTLEFELKVPLRRDLLLGLTNRFHLQGGADFWQRIYVVDEGTIPRWRTLDRELGPLFTESFATTFTWTRSWFSAYLTLNLQYTHFGEFLFLDERTALIGALGVRFDP